MRLGKNHEEISEKLGRNIGSTSHKLKKKNKLCEIFQAILAITHEKFYENCK